MIIEYRLKSARKTFKGWMTFYYKEGRLIRWERSNLCNLTEGQQMTFQMMWPWDETTLDRLKSSNIIVERRTKAESKIGDKTALWCKFYNLNHPIAYQAKNKESYQLADVEVTEPLLTAYFTSEIWWSKPKSITNYVNRINEIRLLLVPKATPSPTASKYPNEWSKAAEAKYAGSELTGFWAHLRALGLKPVKHPVTKQTISWE